MKVKAYPAWRIALVLGVLPKVTGPCETELQKLVEQEPREAGYSFSTWTCADLLRELIRKGFAVVSSESIRTHLHTLGYHRINEILEDLAREKSLSFTDLLKTSRTRKGIIYTLLAILELMKMRVVRAFQADPFGPIRIFPAVEESTDG